MKQASLRRVAGLRIRTQNAGDLRERPVVSRGVFHHVARDKANAAAIDPIRYPNCCDRCLLLPLNHQLHLVEEHNHVLLQHLTANLVLLVQMALTTHCRPYNINENTARMDGLVEPKGHGRRSGRGRKDGGGYFSTDARATAPSTATRGVGPSAAAGAGAAAGSAAFFLHF